MLIFLAGSDNQSYFKKEEEEEVQEEDDQNLDDDGPSPFLIHIRGLPWTTTKQEICDFFAGVNIVNGENGIHIITCAMNNSRPLGEAYIELVSNDDLELALTFDRKNLGKRYIEGMEHYWSSIINNVAFILNIFDYHQCSKPKLLTSNWL